TDNLPIGFYYGYGEYGRYILTDILFYFYFGLIRLWIKIGNDTGNGLIPSGIATKTVQGFSDVLFQGLNPEFIGQFYCKILAIVAGILFGQHDSRYFFRYKRLCRSCQTNRGIYPPTDSDNASPAL